MLVDAIVLAGGRSSRLGSVPKADLVYGSQTLLARTIEAVTSARTVMVVGPVPNEALSDRVRATREDPPFGGPAAGIAAGAAALTTANARQSDYTIVLACDMPGAKTAVGRLLAALGERSADPDGVIAVDTQGHLQPLAAAYNTARLQATLEPLRAAGSLEGLSAFQLISSLRLTRVPVPRGTTDDIDTWADAERFGVERPPRQARQSNQSQTNRHQSDQQGRSET